MKITITSVRNKMGSDPVHLTQPHIDISLLPRCHRRDEGSTFRSGHQYLFAYRFQRQREPRAAYAAAKAGILTLSKTLALDLAPFNVRVNAVAPGRIATNRVRATYSDIEWEAAAKRIPLGHAGEPEDIAEAVAFLASDASRHMTGQTLHINGGRIMP
jgi:NAD(P)-dependent dehydrogenase (short-subunit alcohol dehydrogenase family)